jgi:predicted dienelactone hydrolase
MGRVVRFIVLALLATAVAVPAWSAELTFVAAGLRVFAWSPDGDAAAAPVIVFSHGFHGCATQSRFLTRAWAAAGYVVIAPNHRDATCGGGTSRWSDPPEASLGDPASWTASVYRDRGDDIRRVIAALRADPNWRDRVDWSALGLAGHSLGGYTVLGLAGAWPEWTLPGVKAVLAMSPVSQPFIAARTLSDLTAPVMFQGGTLDFGLSPALLRPMGAYDQAPAPKYLVEFRAAGHLAWTDIGLTAHAGIIATSLAFFDHHLRGRGAGATLTRPSAGVALLRSAM